MKKKILFLILPVLAVIQFIRPARNISEGAQKNYIGNIYPVPDEVKLIFKKACNDCHSNNTNYPWYSNVQPVYWYLNKHVKEGKAELNFDEFTNQSLRFQYGRFHAISYQLKEDDMPLKSYKWLHAGAKLSKHEKETVFNWTESMVSLMKEKYPIDSLERKK